jgi:CheY-like chemotaxis protein
LRKHIAERLLASAIKGNKALTGLTEVAKAALAEARRNPPSIPHVETNARHTASTTGMRELRLPHRLRLSEEPTGTSAVQIFRSKPVDWEYFVRVLVVEDDPLVREFVVEALREQGYDVIHAADGEQALTWCSRRAADVLVTDIRLPGKVDGWQIAERCRQHDPDLPVIYATGFSPVSPRPVPGSVMLQKPFHPEQLVDAVRELTQ